MAQCSLPDLCGDPSGAQRVKKSLFSLCLSMWNPFVDVFFYASVGERWKQAVRKWGEVSAERSTEALRIPHMTVLTDTSLSGGSEAHSTPLGTLGTASHAGVKTLRSAQDVPKQVNIVFFYRIAHLFWVINVVFWQYSIILTAKIRVFTFTQNRTVNIMRC